MAYWIFGLVIALFVVQPAHADRVVQECHVITRETPGLTASQRRQLEQPGVAAIRACSYPNWDTARNWDRARRFALGPVVKSGNRCEISEVSFDDLVSGRSAQPRYMTISDDRCPGYDLTAYVRVYGVSGEEFSAVSQLLTTIGRSGAAFERAAADLRHSRADPKDVRLLMTIIDRRGRLPIIEMFKDQSYLGVWSTFEVEVDAGDRETRFILDLCSLFSHVSLTGLRSLIL